MLDNIFFLISSFLLCNQYYSTYTEALVGYNIYPATFEHYRYVVCIVAITNRSSLLRNILCTGSLITSTSILFAEHCFDNIRGRPYRVIIGSNDLYRGSSFYPAWWISYDQWAIRNNVRIVCSENDIATIKLLTSIPSHFPVVPITTTPILDLYGFRVILVGWGSTNEGQASVTLQTANVTILTNEECRQIFLRFGRQRQLIHPRFLCTKAEPYVHLGNGDSGGPVIYEGQIIAINRGVSPNLDPAFHPDQVNLHLSVTFYRQFVNWILNN